MNANSYARAIITCTDSDAQASLLFAIPYGELPSVSRALDTIAQSATALAAVCDYKSTNPGATIEEAHTYVARRVRKVRKALGYNV